MCYFWGDLYEFLYLFQSKQRECIILQDGLQQCFLALVFPRDAHGRALYSVIESLEPYKAMPTFFIPAVVLERHATLLAEIAEHRAEVGIHGYVHNDYRTLSHSEQYKQTEKAISVFEEKHIPYRGFRNPYLGWTEASLDVFAELGFTYDSNDAVIHDVIDLDQLSPLLLSGYRKVLRTVSSH